MANIKVYARFLPCQSPSELVSFEDNKIFISKSNGGLHVSQSQRNDAERDLYFTFSGILNQDCTQTQVFDQTTRSTVNKFVEGYNGTIFSYGQTGTGKTYTMEGEDCGIESSPKHGLIPHVLALVYKLVDEFSDECVTIQISFLEIYNELVYDLLGPLLLGSNSKRDLPRVLVTLSAGTTYSMHGLSVHSAVSEYEAHKLHLKGKTSRIVSQTSINERSSRSHAIFTIMLTRQKQDSEIVIKSKLNLVDLAGSERVSKTGLDGQPLFEAKHINLSLHHLEGVILALQRLHSDDNKPPLSIENSIGSKRTHRCQSAHLPAKEKQVMSSSNNSSSFQALPRYSSVLNLAEAKRKGISVDGCSSYIPYRNSVLTMVLQDSLGGNCNTTMIATLSLESNNLKETISTCRFAQRLARVTNKPLINKDVNENMLISKLKREVIRLGRRLADQIHEEQDDDEKLHSSETGECINIMDGFLEGRIVDPVAHGIDNLKKFRACFVYLRGILVQRCDGCRDEPTSSDERDSGVGLNCGNKVSAVRNGSVAEIPSSPTDTNQSSDTSLIFSQYTGGQFNCTESRFTRNVETQTTTAKQRRLHHASNSSLQSSLACYASEQPGTPRETEVEANSAIVSGCQVTGGMTERDLLLRELEIEKRNLIQKCKTLNLALADQQARVLVMEKHGGSPDELENERIVEQHLLRKRSDVERRLSVLVKKIADMNAVNYSNRRYDKSAGQNQTQFPGEKDPAHRSRELELQERATRQKLLSCRQQLERGLKTHPRSPSDSQAIQTYNSPSRTSNYSEETTSARTFNGSESTITFYEGRPKTERIQGRRAELETGVNSPNARRVPSTDTSNQVVLRSNRRRRAIVPGLSSRIKSIRSFSSAWMGSLPSVENTHSFSTSKFASSKGRRGRLSSILSTENGLARSHTRSTPRSSMVQDTDGGNLIRTRLSRGLPTRVTLCERDEVQFRENSRARRPATCSVSHPSYHRPLKKNTSVACGAVSGYELDQSKGFIMRTNDIVYRVSSFVQVNGLPVDSDSEKISDMMEEHALLRAGPLSNSNVKRTETILDPSVADGVMAGVPLPVGQEDSVTKENRTKVSSSFKKGGACDTGNSEQVINTRTNTVENGRTEAKGTSGTTSSMQSPVAVAARKQQVERARRIRQITKAVSVIQRAYRLHLRRTRLGLEDTETNEKSIKL